jgi:exosortase
VAANRWRTRPPPSSSLKIGLWGVGAAALAFFPTWVFAQPNPDWSLVGWVMTGQVVMMALGTVAYTGGLSWLSHFAFPVCFILTAVPWPRVIESRLTIGLMGYVTSCTVEFLNLVGIAALQHGNLIEIRGGLLGVEEACSGIHSLQASLMASLFLGELYRMTWGRRGLLLLAGFLVALVTNVGRTAYLALSAAKLGVSVMTARHDSAGFTTLAICFGLVWLISLLLSEESFRFERGHSMACGHSVSLWFAGGLTLWLLGVLGATEMWYYDADESPQAHWRISSPPQSEPVEVPVAVRAQLQCDRISAATWREANGARWLLYFLEWNPGPLRARVLARVHRPEVCLSSIGMKLIEDRGFVTVKATGVTLPFHAYTFKQDTRLVFVYFGTWQNRTTRGRERGPLSESEHVAGVQAVLWRERNLGQQVAEVAVTGYTNGQDADTEFLGTMERLIVTDMEADRIR